MGRRYKNEPIYSAAIGAGRSLFGLLGVRRRVTGAENLPDTGGAVIAVTHFGYLEFAMMEWVTWLHNRRRIRFMAKKGAFRGWPLGAMMRNMKHISVDREAGSHAYDDAVAALKRGELVGVFPEGTVSESFEVQRLKTGAVRLAAEAGVPIIPVAIWGAHRILTKNGRSGLRDRFGTPVSFAIGAPIVVDQTDEPLAATDRLRATMQEMVERLQADYPVNGAGRWWQSAGRGGTAPTAAAVERHERRPFIA